MGNILLTQEPPDVEALVLKITDEDTTWYGLTSTSFAGQGFQSLGVIASPETTFGSRVGQ